MDNDRPGHLGDGQFAALERALIDEYLQSLGYSQATLGVLPREQAEALLKQASTYASGRMTEVESRYHYVHDIHDPAEPPRRR